MSSDLVKRLRTYSADTMLCDDYADAMQDAADEIERLCAINSGLCRKANALTIQAARDAEEIERLRAALAVQQGPVKKFPCDNFPDDYEV